MGVRTGYLVAVLLAAQLGWSSPGWAAASHDEDTTYVQSVPGDFFGTNSTAPGTTSTLRASGPWLWSCTGSNGGSNAQCSAHLLSNTGGNGTCGSANGTSDNNAPTTGLCSSGTASALSGNGAPWTWSCGSSQCWATLPAYYVSTSGNDSNNGTSPSTPFASLGKAQSALQGSGTKIAYIRAGTYRPPSVGSGGACESGRVQLGKPRFKR